ncbi:hypothetical protein ACGGYM_000196 [Salmonella enterica]|uniref:hypothetical protein n=1 Tax=Salmonella enterica TaxID=28901 RepID=UPI0015909C50|nr:hypothetical protein [Salmonella enterica]EDU7907197.1 hypothetical protein [Salmonella enterica subsp. diarizonae]EKN5802231.1 hypothetical protein [Salmonella enterica subsp. enterica]EDS4573735.1 hypothetical protein [Salmonella enterica]EDV3806177.1 hypothetical protein [Salmonella enterica subsp. diarizonae]EDZ9608458.1 hypothetical protein [Salmonella enterica]
MSSFTTILPINYCVLLFIEGPSEEPGQSEADMLHVGMATQRCHTWRNASLLRNNIDSP